MNTGTGRRARRHWRVMAAAIAASLVVAACGGDDDDDAAASTDDAPAATEAGGDDAPAATDAPADAGEQVVLSVSNLPPSTEQETRDAFMTRVEEFEAANPDIDVEPSEYEWDVATFAAQMTGGTLPTVFQIPFPDTRGLVERGQVADITAQFEALPYAERFNPNVLAVAQDAAGKVYGVPFAAYGIGLHYNRQLFHGGRARSRPAADDVGRGARRRPRRSPTRPVRPASPSCRQNNTGGWMLTALTVANGGRLQEGTGDDTAATIDNPGTVKALELLRVDALGRQLDGEQLPLRVGDDQPGVRGRADRHVHDGLGRLQQPRHRERGRSRPPTA